MVLNETASAAFHSIEYCIHIKINKQRVSVDERTRALYFLWSFYFVSCCVLKTMAATSTTTCCCIYLLYSTEYIFSRQDKTCADRTVVCTSSTKTLPDNETEAIWKTKPEGEHSMDSTGHGDVIHILPLMGGGGGSCGASVLLF